MERSNFILLVEFVTLCLCFSLFFLCSEILCQNYLSEDVNGTLGVHNLSPKYWKRMKNVNLTRAYSLLVSHWCIVLKDVEMRRKIDGNLKKKVPTVNIRNTFLFSNINFKLTHAHAHTHTHAHTLSRKQTSFSLCTYLRIKPWWSTLQNNSLFFSSQPKDSFAHFYAETKYKEHQDRKTFRQKNR